jgi:hypothetical protein
MNKQEKIPSKVRLVEVRAPEEWYSRVAAEARRLGLPVSTFIRVAVNDWLDRRYQQLQSTPPALATDAAEQGGRVAFRSREVVENGPSSQSRDGRSAQVETARGRTTTETTKESRKNRRPNNRSES